MSDEIAGWERFMAWREAAADAAAAAGVPMSYGMPDAWYAAGVLGCQNGHRTLARVRKMFPGKACISCNGLLMVVPPSVQYSPDSAFNYADSASPPTQPTDPVETFNARRTAMLEAWRDLAQRGRAQDSEVTATTCAMRQLMQVCAPEDKS